MKKLVLLLSFLLISTANFAQKAKSKTTPSKKTNVPKNVVLAKADNVTAEVISIKNENKVVLFVKTSTSTDTLELKKIETTDFKPSIFTLKSYMANGKKCYHVNWKEQVKTDTKLKKETTDITEDQLWDTETKTLLLGNTHKSSHI